VGKTLQAKSLFNVWRRFTGGSGTRQVFGAAITVALLATLVKLVTVAQELVVAYRFGISDTLDAFWIALLIPSLFTYVLGGSLNVALIPSFIQVREREGTQAAQKLLSEVIAWSINLLGIITVLLITTAPLYLRLLASGFSPEKLALTTHLLYIVAPIVLLGGISNVWGAVLNAGERFALVALAPVAVPAMGALLLLAAKSWGIFALALGMVCGGALEMALLGLALKRQGFSLRPRWSGRSASLRQVARQFTPKMAGAFLRSGSSLVDHAMAAMLLAGSVAALNYGYRVIGPLLGVAGTALGTAVTPYFSKMVVGNELQALSYTFKRFLFLIFLLTIPAALMLFLFSETIVRLLFQRGSFDAGDALIVGQIQAFYALQIPFFMANVLATRLISALFTNYLLLWSAAIYLAVSVVLNLLLIKPLGVAGIALSTSCASLINFAFLSSCLTRLLRERRTM
jgi:putative peptidoglycan lipid II flippase